MSTNGAVVQVARGLQRRDEGCEEYPITFDLLQFAGDLLRDAPAKTGGAPRLIWRAADGAVQTMPVTRPLTLGCDPGCDVVFSCVGVSPMHCLLGPSGTIHEIVDLGSVNGTVVNVIQVGRTLSPLADGDLIRLGKATALFAK